MTKCKVIALANQKGGTAKTTTTLNLGIGLVHQGRKVLMVDADPQGDLTTALGWTDADNLPITLETQMKKILQDEPFVYNEGILHHEEGVDIIPTIFGIIKELKQCNYVKVIVIANTDEIQSDKKVVFEKYNEKVIERIYHITERAEKVTWSKMNIHADFVEKFLEIHKVKNLRTLEKAQRFFEDVKLFCNSDMSEQFKEELRLICFAVVVESIENLYYKEIDSDNSDSVEKMANTIGNMPQHRIGRYLYGIKCSTNLVEMILKYYEEGVLNEEQLEAEYKLFLNSGDKPNYYKSDEEIRLVLPILREKMLEAKSLAELNEFADAYVVWNDVLEEKIENEK
jgi:cellulose biosynthesis protein BcsQ